MIQNASLHELPDTHKLKFTIDMKAHPGEFWLLQLGSVLLLAPFVLPYLWGWIPFGLSMVDGLGWVLILQIPMIVVHEAIHGFVYKLATDRKVVYKFHGFAASASVPGTYFYLPHYLKVGLAPAVVLNLLFLILTLISSGSWQLIWYLMLAIHFASCVGDFYVTLRVMRLPKDSLVEDYGIGMRIFVRE